MPTLIATLKVREDKVDEAAKLFREIAAEVQEKEPGTLTYVAHQKKDDPTSFVFYEQYESDEALKQHSANLATRRDQLVPVIAGPPELIMLETL